MLVMGMVVLSTVMMDVRGVYRSVELCQGWRGYLILRQGFVIGMDAVLMGVAMGGLVVVNPGMVIREYEGRGDGEKGSEVESV